MSRRIERLNVDRIGGGYPSGESVQSAWGQNLQFVEDGDLSSFVSSSALGFTVVQDQVAVPTSAVGPGDVPYDGTSGVESIAPDDFGVLVRSNSDGYGAEVHVEWAASVRNVDSVF